MQMNFSPTGTSVPSKSSEPVTLNSIPGTPSHVSPGSHAQKIELEHHARGFDDLGPFLTSRGEAGVFQCTFAQKAMKAASQNSHYLCCLRSNSFIEGLTTWLPKQNIFKLMPVGFGELRIRLGTFLSLTETECLRVIYRSQLKMHIPQYPTL